MAIAAGVADHDHAARQSEASPSAAEHLVEPHGVPILLPPSACQRNTAYRRNRQ